MLPVRTATQQPAPTVGVTGPLLRTANNMYAAGVYRSVTLIKSPPDHGPGSEASNAAITAAFHLLFASLLALDAAVVVFEARTLYTLPVAPSPATMTSPFVLAVSSDAHACPPGSLDGWTAPGGTCWQLAPVTLGELGSGLGVLWSTFHVLLLGLWAAATVLRLVLTTLMHCVIRRCTPCCLRCSPGTRTLLFLKAPMFPCGLGFLVLLAFAGDNELVGVYMELYVALWFTARASFLIAAPGYKWRDTSTWAAVDLVEMVRHAMGRGRAQRRPGNDHALAAHANVGAGVAQQQHPRPANARRPSASGWVELRFWSNVDDSVV